ncbi:RING-type domain-containing protein [Mycena chlorophos]|uniref:RING-type domain-containing protein n=1 Tax=Mycena chlorophos TaxID=658473 RepID=A0A8H6S3M4_MYCCL|nr:RING-type domain-containing protein [Mycena chlorophos]
MLSLGPGSSCDVCLEPFTENDKAPCSIPCGHVFCSTCLQSVERPTCPLCRQPFQARHIIKLHVDVESLRPPAAPHSLSAHSSPDETARHLQERIIILASSGATEEQTTQLTADCKGFLASVPKKMYADLRTAVNMLIYIAHVKKLYRTERQQTAALGRSNEGLSQELDRIKASVEALKLERRRLEQNAQADRDNAAAEHARIQEQLSKVEGQLVLMTEYNETAQNQLVLLNEELQRLRLEAEFSSPEGDSPADIPSDYPPELPQPALQWAPYPADLDRDPSAPFFTPWESVIEAQLPVVQDPCPPQDNKAVSMIPSTALPLCGAAGCPHSCNCTQIYLFSPGAQARAAAGNLARFGDSFQSGISLMREKRSRSRSRSLSRPRSRSLSRAPSPSASASPPEAMALSLNIPSSNPHAYALRGRLQDLLTDPSAPLSTSLPNMSSAHLPASPSPLAHEFRQSPSSSTRAPASRASPSPLPVPQPQPTSAGMTSSKTQLHPPMTYSGASSSRAPHPPMLYKAKEPASASAIHPPMVNSGGLTRERPSPSKSQTYPNPSLHPPMIYGPPTTPSPLPIDTRPPLYRSTSSTVSAESTPARPLSDKEKRRAEKSAARHPPMILPPSPSPASSSSSLSSTRMPAPPVVHAASASAYLQQQAPNPPAMPQPQPPQANKGATNSSSFTVLDRHIRQTERDVIAAYNTPGTNPSPAKPGPAPAQSSTHQSKSSSTRRIHTSGPTMQMAAADALLA